MREGGREGVGEKDTTVVTFIYICMDYNMYSSHCN